MAISIPVQVYAVVAPGGTYYIVDGNVILNISGAVPLSELGSYARGSIIRGGASKWEAYDASVAGAVLIGDGTDVISTANPVFAGTLTLPNVGLHLLDTNASHDLIIAPGSDLTADRTLTLTTGDAARTITLSGNPTLADWFDQSVKVAATPTFASLSLANSLTFTGADGINDITVPDNLANALSIYDSDGLEYVRVVSTDANPYILLDPAGAGINVGIGTTGPDSLLTLAQPDDSVGLKIYGYDDKSANTAETYVDVHGNAYFYGNRDVFLQSALDVNIISGSTRNIVITPGTGDLIINTASGKDMNVGSGQLFVQGSNGNVGFGTTTPDRLTHAEVADAVTNAVTYAQRLTHICSTASTGLAAGGGVGLEFELETATDGTNQIAATIESVWVDATNATRKARGLIYAYDTAARECIRWEASGAASMLGFYGVAAVVRPTALTAGLTGITYTAPGTPDYAIQDFVDVSLGAGWAFKDHDEANTVLSVIANLQTRVGELETKLQSLGLLT